MRFVGWSLRPWRGSLGLVPDVATGYGFVNQTALFGSCRAKRREQGGHDAWIATLSSH
jgi:hypothetical protein